MPADPKTLANGKQCYDCGTIFEDDTDISYCENCDKDSTEVALTLVQILECPNDDLCESDNHHFGIHKHVIEIQS